MQYLLALTLLLTPAYVIKFNIFGFPTNLLMVWAVLVWVIFGIWIIAKKQIPPFLMVIKNTNRAILIFTGLFFLSGLISLFVGGFDRAKLGQFIVLFLEPISIFFIGRYLVDKFPRACDLFLASCYLLRSEERRVGKECRSRWS